MTNKQEKKLQQFLESDQEAHFQQAYQFMKNVGKMQDWEVIQYVIRRTLPIGFDFRDYFYSKYIDLPKTARQTQVWQMNHLDCFEWFFEKVKNFFLYGAFSQDLLFFLYAEIFYSESGKLGIDRNFENPLKFIYGAFRGIFEFMVHSQRGDWGKWEKITKSYPLDTNRKDTLRRLSGKRLYLQIDIEKNKQKAETKFLKGRKQLIKPREQQHFVIDFGEHYYKGKLAHTAFLEIVKFMEFFCKDNIREISKEEIPMLLEALNKGAYYKRE